MSKEVRSQVFSDINKALSVNLLVPNSRRCSPEVMHKFLL